MFILSTNGKNLLQWLVAGGTDFGRILLWGLWRHVLAKNQKHGAETSHLSARRGQGLGLVRRGDTGLAVDSGLTTDLVWRASERWRQNQSIRRASQ